jgi:hypothetical protein
MKQNYGPGTNVVCRGTCRRRIHLTEIERTYSDGQWWISVECSHPICSLYGQLVTYNEEALEIHGTMRV